VKHEKKTKDGSISAERESGAVTQAIISSTSFVNGFFDTFSRLGPVLGTLSILGLSKPETLARTEVMKIDPYTDWVFGKGISLANKISVDPENAISVAPTVAGISTDEMMISRIIGTPCITFYSAFHSSDTGGTFFIGNIGLGEDNVNYLDDMSNFFSYWHGSFKFKIDFYSTSLQEIRGAIMITDHEDSQWENAYNKVITISGDTSIEFEVPYLEKNVCQTIADSSTFSLYWVPLSYNQPNPSANAPYYMVVYKAAGSDFEFGAPREQLFQPTGTLGVNHKKQPDVELHNNPRAEFAKDFPAFHSSFKSYKTEGYVWGEKISTLRELAHRKYPLFGSPGGGVYCYDSSGYTSGAYYTGIEMYGMWYNAWRGSIIVTAQSPNIGSGYPTSVIATNGGAYIPGMYTTSINNPLVDVVVPYYYQDLYQLTSATSNIEVLTIGQGQRFFWKCAGDDFSFHFLRARPPGLFLPSTSQIGMFGYATWLGAITPS